MLRSMTGYGQADGVAGGGRLQVEIRTVNHRHFNVQLRLPGTLQPLESTIRDALRGRIERGHVSVSARWLEEPDAAQPAVRLDLERARAILAAARELQTVVDVPGDVDLAFLLRQPDVLRYEAPEPASPDADAVLALVGAALDGVVAMREQEGTALTRELVERLDLIRRALAGVRDRAPARAVAERDRLRAAVAELLDGRDMDPDRLAQEIAMTAERLDVTEEMVRLDTHLDAARDVLDGSAPGGRRLGFLAQEMLREINTIGSKANDAAITAAVIEMKEELERFREQLENVE